jgi:hypothetical protein
MTHGVRDRAVPLGGAAQRRAVSHVMISSSRSFAVASALVCAACTWRTSPPPPSMCSMISRGRSSSRPVFEAGSAPLSVPYTVVIDDFVLGAVHSESDSVAMQLHGLDAASIRSTDIVRSPEAEKRWPAALGDVLHVTLCHEPARTTRLAFHAAPSLVVTERSDSRR